MTTTLIVDGDNLLTIGFYGYKNCFYKGTHIGGIYHFLNTLRKTFEIHHLDKICVFWDGKNGSSQRKEIYPFYKNNRKQSKTEEEEHNYQYQKNRIQQYLEEIYVRQGEYENCESDDCIAFYVQNSPNEKKIIFSSDGDLTQLVSDKTQIYNPNHRKLYGPKDIYQYDHENVLIENIKIIKIICGDPSDNITGIKNMGIKRLTTLFPEITTQKLTLDYIRNKTKYLITEGEDSKISQSLLKGETKFGEMGDEFFDINSKIVDLSANIFLTQESKNNILELINDRLDTTGRSYKNAMKLMMEDGVFNLLPKRDDGWIEFLNPFLKLTRKEKNRNVTKFRI